MLEERLNPSLGLGYVVGGSASDSRITESYQVATDSAGDAYITGYFDGTSTFGGTAYTTDTQGEAFIAKYSPTGSLIWLDLIGGQNSSDSAVIAGIAVDSSGNAYVAGDLKGSDIDFASAAGSTSLAAASDGGAAFVLKVTASGQFGYYAPIASVSQDVAPSSIAVDSSGNVYTTGDFHGSNVNFNPNGATPEDLSTSSNGADTNVFVTKLNTSGQFVYDAILGYGIESEADTQSKQIAVDSLGEAYIVGSFQGGWGDAVDFDPSGNGPDKHVSSDDGNDTNGFVVQLTPSGQFGYMDLIGYGSSDSVVESVAAGSKGNIFIAGDFKGTDVELTNEDFSGPNKVASSSNNGSDQNGFVEDLLDSEPTYIDLVGYGGQTDGSGIAVDSKGNVYVTGSYSGASVNFDPSGTGPDNLASGQLVYNTFVLQLTSSNNLGFVTSLGSGNSSAAAANGIALDSSNDIDVTGAFTGADVNFDPGGSGSDNLTSAANGSINGSSMFLVQLLQPLSDQLSLGALPNGTENASYSATITAGLGVAPYTFSVISGTLPPGLSLSSTGAVTGTPTTAGTFDFTIGVNDSSGLIGYQSYDLTIQPPMLSLSGLPNGDENLAYSATINAGLGVAPYTFSVLSGTLPAGLSLSSTGAVTGTPTTTGTYDFTIGVNDSSGLSGYQTYDLTIALPMLSLSALPNGDDNLAYSATISAGLGVAPYTFSVIRGTLPAGLSLSSTGAVTGTPTTAGTFDFTIGVNDSSGLFGYQGYALTMAPPITFTGPVLEEWTLGEAGFRQTITAGGGTGVLSYTLESGPYFVGFNLPGGLTLNSNTGVISGTPDAAGIFKFSIVAVDSLGANSTQSYTIIISSLQENLNPTLGMGFLTGGSSNDAGDSGASVVTDSAGDMYSVGGFSGESTNGLATFGGVTYTCASEHDGYIAKYSPTGSLLWIDVIGGNSEYDFASFGGLALDSSGNVYIHGYFNGTDIYITTAGGSTFLRPPASDEEDFILKVTASGQISFVQELATTIGVQPHAIAVDSSGNIYLSGEFDGADVNFNPNGAQPYYLSSSDGGSGFDGFVAKFNASGQLIYAELVGNGYGNIDQQASTGSLAFDSLGDLYVAGYFTGTEVNFDPSGSGPDNLSSFGGGSNLGGTGFICELSPTGQLDFVHLVGYGGSYSDAAGLKFDSSGDLYVTGSFAGTDVNFDPGGSGRDDLTSFTTQEYSTGIYTNGFVLKLSPSGQVDWVDLVGYNAVQSDAGGIAIDPEGNVYVVGGFSGINGISGVPGTSVNFDPTGSGPDNLTAATDEDGYYGSENANNAYVLKLTPTGQLAFVDLFGFIGNIDSEGLALNSAGDIDVAGSYDGPNTNFDPDGAGSDTMTSAADGTAGSSWFLFQWTQLSLGSLANGTENAAYNQAISVTGGVGPDSFSVIDGSLPAGLTLNDSTGAIAGTPTTPGTYDFTIAANDSSGLSGFQSYALTIAPPVSINTQSLAPWTENVGGYSQHISASGGTGTLSFGVESGETLPGGLSLSAATGAIAGTPNAMGDFTFSIVATDSVGASATQSFTLDINAPVSLGGVLSGWTEDLSGFSQTLSESGGTGALSFSVESGNRLPSGLTLASATGVISGTPTAAGTFTFDIVASDSVDSSATQAFTIVVADPVSLSAASPAGWTEDVAGFSQTLSESGGTGTLSFSVESGDSLPNGLTLASTGAITGTPIAPGTFTFDIIATDSVGSSATQAFTIVIANPVSLNAGALAGWTENVAGFSQTLSASGGTGALTYSVESGETLPGGLTLASATGAITGKPTAAGTFAFDIVANDTVGSSATQAFTIVIADPVSLGGSLAGWTEDVAGYSQTLRESGGTGVLSFSVKSGDSLPNGLTLASATGEITGKPTAAGTFTFHIIASDSLGSSATQSYSIDIADPVSLSATALAGWTEDLAGFSQTLRESGGTGVLSFSVESGDSLPNGLTLASATGAITGTPTAAGTFTFDIVATDSVGSSATQAYTVDIADPVSLSAAALAGWTENVAGYSQTLSASGGTGALTYSVESGETLPSGLTLASVTGAITGKPTAAGTFTFDIVASDSVGSSATQAFTVDIADPVSLSAGALESWTENVAGYSQTISASGGTGALTYSVESGNSLPSGLTLASSTGTIVGKPTATGTFTFHIVATDSLGSNTTQGYTIAVAAVAAPVSLSAGPLANWTENVAGYSQTLSASGGTGALSFSVESGDSLPGGLTLDGNTGVISGTPDATGIFKFSIVAVDSVGANTTQSYTVLISSPTENLNPTLGVGFVTGGNANGNDSLQTGVSALVTDNAGDCYVAGTFTGAVTFGGITYTCNSEIDGYVAKYSPTGSLLWIDVVGGNNETDVATLNHLALDSAGNAYVTGFFSGTDIFLTTASGSTFLRPPEDEEEVFILKVTASGQLGYVEEMASSGDDASPASIAVDSAGNVYTSGGLRGSDVNFDPNGTQPDYLSSSDGGNGFDGYVAKWNASGQLVYAALVGNGYGNTYQESSVYALALDSLGDVYVAGSFTGTEVNFDPTGSGPDNLFSYGGGSNLGGTGFICELSPTGQLDFVHLVGFGGSYSYVNDLELDSSGDIDVAGSFSGTNVNFDPSGSGPNDLSSVNTVEYTTGLFGNGFVLKLTPSGQFDWVDLVGAGAVESGAQSIAIDAEGNVYVAGGFSGINATSSSAGTSVNFDPSGSGPDNLTPATDGYGYYGSENANNTYVLKLTPTGQFAFVDLLGYIGDVGGANMALDNAGNIDLAGSFYGVNANFDPDGAGNDTLTSAADGNEDDSTLYLVQWTQLSLGSLANGTENSAYSQTISVTSGVSPDSFSVIDGNLPAGLTLNDSTGAITGTPTTYGTYDFTIAANDSSGLSGFKSYGVTIAAPFSISTQSLAPWTDNLGGYSQHVSVSGGAGGLSYNVEAGTNLPGGLSLNATSGVIAGTPSAVGNFTFSIVATDSAGASATQSYTVDISAPVSIATSAPADWTDNLSGYAQTISASGGTGTLTFSLKPGSSLPSGLTLDSATGAIIGTPTASGTFNFSIVVDDSVGSTATQTFSIVVYAEPSFTNSNSDVFAAGQTNSFTFATSFPSTTFTSSGLLPPGVTFTDNGNGTATLSGSPAPTTGAFTFDVVATSVSASPITQTFTLTVVDPPTITSADATTFLVGASGHFSITTTPGLPATTTLTESGALPSGIKFSASGGVATLSGTPTSGADGAYEITITAKNAAGSMTTQAFTLTIDQSAAITSAATATFDEGQAAAPFTVRTAGFPAPKLSATALPSGLTFTDNGNSTATISGTPQAGVAPGDITVTITAANSAGSVSQSFNLVLDEPIAFTSANNTSLTAGNDPPAFKITTAGFPVATLTRIGALPSGIEFVAGSNGTATLSGKPAAGTGGTYDITFIATNSAGSKATETFTLTVNQAPAITSAAAATFVVGQTGKSFEVTTTGFPKPALTAATLPAGLTFTDNGNGTATISGTPEAGDSIGSIPVTITATNGTANVSRSFTLVLDEAPSFTSAQDAAFTAGRAGSAFTVTTQAGFPAITTLTESGALPKGITFSPHSNGTATLTGTPAANSGGTYDLTIIAGNAGGLKTSQAFTLTVDQAPAITSAAAVTFVVAQTGKSFEVTTTGFPKPALTATTLPAGQTFTDNGNGIATISGTPEAGDSIGAIPITITATNGTASVSKSFTLVLDEAPSFTSAPDATFTVGHAGSAFTVATQAGYPSITTLTESGALPKGVTFAAYGNGTATLTGTPPTNSGGNYDITIIAGNTAGLKTSQAFTLTVDQAPAFTSSSTATFVLGRSGTSFNVATTGFPKPALSATGLPAGLSFTDNGNGAATISGTPQAADPLGPSTVTIIAVNGSGSATQTFTLVLNEPPIITSANDVSFILGVENTFTITTIGYPVATTIAESGKLPLGVTFVNEHNGNAILSGTPTTIGTFTFTITASDGLYPESMELFTLIVA